MKLMNKYRKQISKRNKYREFIQVLNGVLDLTAREIDILVALFLIEAALPKGRIRDYGLITKEVRLALKTSQNMTKSNLSKVESRLKDKGVLIPSSVGVLIINPLFKPEIKDDGMEITFKLDFKTKEDETITI